MPARMASSESQFQQRQARRREDNYREAEEGIFIRNQSDGKREDEFTLIKWV